MRLVLFGWGLAVLLAALIVVDNGLGDAGFSLTLAFIAAAMAAWVWLRATRAASIASLVLGLLLLLLFGEHTLSDATGGNFESQLFFMDMIGVIAGIAVVAGAVQVLVQQRRGTQARTA
jgi:Na+/proline symporter